MPPSRVPGGPPTEAPERVFRSLLARRPQRHLAYRVRGAEHIPLRVVALRSSVESDGVDAANAGPEEVRGSRIRAEVLALCLHGPDGPAFASADEVGLLDQTQFDALWAEALEALAIISPSYARSDVPAWERVLQAGASHMSNLHDAMVLASCVDSGFSATAYRPDRYWGVPPCELLDGHWMAFAAARSVWDAMAKKSKR